MRNRGHVRGIRLQDNTIHRHHLGQDFREWRLLEGKNATDAQDKIIELEEFTGFDLIARETM